MEVFKHKHNAELITVTYSCIQNNVTTKLSIQCHIDAATLSAQGGSVQGVVGHTLLVDRCEVYTALYIILWDMVKKHSIF